MGLWGQKFFLELFEKKLVYRKENYVNWDPVDETVLANEQVIDGKGWRSGAVVERKKLNQWFLNISKFSQELLDGLEKLDPNKEMVLFCAAGGRSALAANTLKEMGFEKVSHIEGGFGAMKNSGFKTS